MYFLTHCGDRIGSTKLESGDPSIFAVSGLFNNVGGAKPLAAWIESIGGEEEEGVFYIHLNSDFCLQDEQGAKVSFTEGSLIAVPGDNEVYLDLIGVPESEYAIHFAKHLTALGSGD